ncbi:hypothetical protein V5O48_017003 [Marasmius crinis-equi]|uniref:BTB domain-containing protein n=1 Tax=Marasmius crinis-equi TaxID=585013 RepID=A0ABR3EQ63_9AGAR
MARINELKPELNRTIRAKEIFHDALESPLPLKSPSLPPVPHHRHRRDSNAPSTTLVAALAERGTPSKGSLDSRQTRLGVPDPREIDRKAFINRPAIQQPPKPRDDYDASKHTKHEKFWFYDGSVVLNVDDNLFRVHKTILSTHCEVFETLFSIPQQASLKEERIEGCPVVRLAGDKANDMSDLLSALYFSSHFDALQTPTADPSTMLTFISGILRLSTKYLNPVLRTKCISILHSYIPTTLSAYDLYQTASSKRPRFKSDELMQCFRLAQETNVPTVLPYLFYCIARLSPQRIMKDSETNPSEISWRDKTIAMVGRERLRHAEMSMSHSFLLGFVPSPNCKSIFLCSAARGPHTAWHNLDGSGKGANPLKEFGKWKDLNVCDECVEFCKGQHEEGRKAVWMCLPALFEMERWEGLREREGESLSVLE